MMRKIIGILVCTLMIIAAFIPAAGTMKIFNDYGPVVDISSPDDGYETTDLSVVVEGSIITGGLLIDGYGYTIVYPDGGTDGDSWILDPPVEYYEFSIDIGIIVGEQGNLITIYATDTQDNEGTDSVTVYRVGGGDTEPPVVTIIYPEDNMVITTPGITVTGTATDNVGVASMRVIHDYDGGSDDSGPIPFTPSPEVSFEHPLTLRAGINTITVWMYDEAVNKGFDIVEVQLKPDCTHGTPRVTDSSGKTKFFGVFIGINYTDTDHELDGAENAANAMYETLKNKPGWSTSRMKKLIGDDAEKEDIRNAVKKFKDGKDDPPDAQPGDEFLFFFSGHGYNHTRDATGVNADEPDKLDESILAADEMDITDDDLKGILSGFPECVTITVKLDCCHSGGFKDGKRDVQHAEDENHKEYGPKKINIEASCGADEEAFEDPYYWDDKNKDGIATPDEYERELGIDFDDKDGDREWDEDEEGWYWNDKDGDGIVDPGEHVDLDSKNVSFMTKFTKENLKGIQSSGGSQLQYTGYTNADKNMDGVTTTRELYEYTINNMYNECFGDNDGDGLVDEDYGTYEIDELEKIRVYIDEDQDGFLDEDPAPPMSAFWPNDPPDKPGKPAGKKKGNAGKTYTYTTSTNDPDVGDQIWYWFEWGDGTNSGWQGPYAPGVACSENHEWSSDGDYNVKVKARDGLYAESEWSENLKVSMPKAKSMMKIYPFILEKLPILLRLFQSILVLK